MKVDIEKDHLPAIGQTISMHIHGLGSSGEGVGYFDGYTFFIDGALPGEEVEARVFERHKRYGRAHLVKVLKTSCDRVTPPCRAFGKCGGCHLMHLAYSKQLEVKRQKVIDALERIGKLENLTVDPCVSAPFPLGYRNKIQLPVRPSIQGIQLGLYARSSHDLVSVETCHIHSSLGEKVYQRVGALIKHSEIEPYDPRSHSGELRHVLIKSALYTQEVLVILVTNKNPSSLLKYLAQEIMSSSSEIKGVVHNLQKAIGNVILGDEYSVLEGIGYIYEHLCGLKFKVSPASFFQVNPVQAQQLYFQALAYAELTGSEIVLDAYCGVGTLSLIFAQNAHKVIGVECTPEAIEDAKENAKMNNIHNVSFHCASSETFITSVSYVDVVLLNPPRKGCDPLFLERIALLSPKRLVYISCDPTTLARDLAFLSEHGYRVDSVCPYDMFPQTAHVECVVKLIRCVL